jgi:hypothetical protein
LAEEKAELTHQLKEKDKELDKQLSQLEELLKTRASLRQNQETSGEDTEEDHLETDHTAAPGSSTSTIYKKYNLTKENLNMKCSHDHILDIGKFISWREVGRRLKTIEDVDIRNINRDGKDEDDKRRLLLELWMERNASDAIYGEIINAMMKEQKRDEAEKVCQLLSKSNPWTSNDMGLF